MKNQQGRIWEMEAELRQLGVQRKNEDEGGAFRLEMGSLRRMVSERQRELEEADIDLDEMTTEQEVV